MKTTHPPRRRHVGYTNVIHRVSGHPGFPATCGIASPLSFPLWLQKRRKEKPWQQNQNNNTKPLVIPSFLPDSESPSSQQLNGTIFSAFESLHFVKNHDFRNRSISKTPSPPTRPTKPKINAMQHPTPPLSGLEVTSFTQYVTRPPKYRKGNALKARKATRSRPFNPTKEDRLQNALAAITNNRLSLQEAAKLYGIHQSTLMDRKSGKLPLEASKQHL